ncbi:MAG: AbrB/MazE/SpoVT family DNA-binding domain-containing protein [Candidatus Woesearchaeota archaeon]
MEFAIAKISTKGQIVIPSGLRNSISKGDEFLMVKERDKIILKSVKGLATDLVEDFKFAEKVEKAWTDHDKGKFKRRSKDDFLEELRAC